MSTKKQSLLASPRIVFIILFLAFVIGGIALVSLKNTVRASFGVWGDSSLINACQGQHGQITIASGSSCNANDTKISWLKDVNVGDGLTETRDSSGVTVSLSSPGVTRYGSNGTGLATISPSATWIDVPNAAITQTFTGGVWKATYTGSVVMTNGDGTAYVRFEIRPSGGPTTDSSEMVTMEHISSPSTAEGITQPFTLQALLTLPSGSVTVVPQVYSNNTSWSLIGPSKFIIEH